MAQSTSFRTIRQGMLMLGVVLLTASPRAYALEDVPPAVPVHAVQAESLPLPEPIYKKPESKPEQPAGWEKTQKKTSAAEQDKPNLLERFWRDLKDVASPAKAAKENKEKDSAREEKTYKAPVVIVEPDSLKTTIIEENEVQAQTYLTKVLHPVMPEGSGFYVLELFTTQACPFCPKADSMMETYSALSHVIALSCHIDYFDVQKGSLSLPICSTRQKRYESFLKGQPKYTPQMVVNGRYDAVGYLPDKIAKAFKHAHEYPVGMLMVWPQEAGQSNLPTYRVELPGTNEGRYHLWLIAYDTPHDVKVSDGANAGKNMTYYNAVSKAEFLGSWDGQPKEVTFEGRFGENTKGFAFLVQNMETGIIHLAGKNE